MPGIVHFTFLICTAESLFLTETAVRQVLIKQVRFTVICTSINAEVMVSGNECKRNFILQQLQSRNRIFPLLHTIPVCNVPLVKHKGKAIGIFSNPSSLCPEYFRELFGIHLSIRQEYYFKRFVLSTSCQ